MKLKYYLRGLGTGILVTTIILSIAHFGDKAELTDEEIRVRAEALGMVMQEDKLFPNANKNENTESTENKADTERETEFTESTENKANTELPSDGEVKPENEEEIVDEREKYQLHILSGMIPSQICGELQEQGVIENASSLHQYITDMGYATSIIAGEYLIPYGASDEEIYQILKKGPIQ